MWVTGVQTCALPIFIITVSGNESIARTVEHIHETGMQGKPGTEDGGNHHIRDRRPEQIRQAMYYFGIILFFAVGAGIGGNLSMRLGFKAIWFSSAVLAVSFLLMFIEEKEKSLC